MATSDCRVYVRVDDITACPICLDDCRDPRSLPCLHTFCFKCIERYCELKLPGDDVECPICRDEFQIPAQGVGQLRHNFFVEQLIAKKSAKASAREVDVSVPSSSREVCQHCLDKDHIYVNANAATVFCLDCRRKLCESCGKTCADSRHTIQKEVTLGGELKPENAMHRGNYCEVHKGELLSLYCTDCETSVCTQCCEEKHNSHENIHLVTAVIEFAQQIIVYVTELEGKVCELNKHREEIGRLHALFTDSADELRQFLQRIADQVSESTDDEITNMVQQLDSIVVQTEKEIAAETDHIDLSLISLGSFINYAQELAMKGSQAAIAGSCRELRHRATQLLKVDADYSRASDIISRSQSAVSKLKFKLRGRKLNLSSVSAKLSVTHSGVETRLITGSAHTKTAETTVVPIKAVHDELATYCNVQSMSVNDRLVNAARNGKPDVVDNLLDRGAAINHIDIDGRTALGTAASHGHVDVIKVLLRRGASINYRLRDGKTPLHNAAQQGQSECVRHLIQNGAEVDGSDKYGRTALFWAVANDKLEVVKILIANRASVDKPDVDGASPLYLAAQEGHLQIVQYLMEKGASTDMPTKDGGVPLMTAARYARCEVIKFLIDNGAPVDASDNDGRTPLHWAAFDGHLAVVILLILNGASVDKPTVGGATPLYMAAQQGHVETVRYLMKEGASIHTPTKSGSFPIMIAAARGHIQVVKLLIDYGDYGAPAVVSDDDGRTPLYWAALNGHFDIVKILADYSHTSINEPDLNGATPLHAAAQEGRLDIVRYLMEKGAYIHTQTIHREYPFMAAARNGHADVVRLLTDTSKC